MSDRLRMRRVTPCAGLSLLACLSGLVGCGRQADEGAPDGEEGGRAQATHEGEVRLDAAQRVAARIRIVRAGPGRVEDRLRLVARVASNENALAHVNPKVEGIVRAIHKGLGDRVEAGDLLAEIWSVELAKKVGLYLKARATVAAGDEALAQAKSLFAKRLATLRKVLDGAILVADRIYEREKSLQEKQIGTLRPFLEADRSLQLARLAKERELTVFEAERDTRMLDLDVAARQARIDEAAARDGLRVLGFDEEALSSVPGDEARYGRMLLRAPRSGVILARHITQNEHVRTDTTLFEIHDLSRVWVLASVYEKDLRLVRRRQKATVSIDSLPGLRFAGEVTLIDYRVAPRTRSVSVRIELANEAVASWPEEYPLRPGMFGSVELVTRSYEGRVVLPERAIVHEGDERFVFVEAEDGAFHRKTVEIHVAADDLVEVVDGVEPGESVVVRGVFVLESLARRGELAEGHGH